MESLNTFELQLLDFIQLHLKNGTMDVLMKYISLLGTAGAVWILISFILLLKKSTRIQGVSLLIAIAIGAVICSCILKPLVGRIRPCDLNTAVQMVVAHPKDYSFPSGHTTAAFAFATCLLFYKNKAWPYFLAFAFIMAFSRLYLYVHFPTDILAGMLIGLLCGWLGYRIPKLQPAKK